ncbi:MAG: DNA methyltransferase [candidate division WOR-3 bacterium]
MKEKQKSKIILKEKNMHIKEQSVPYTEKKIIDIGYQKLCNCPDNKINCLTAKDWVKSQIAIWEFYYEKRDIRDKNIHPAVFPIGLPKKCIELFTHEGELVLDPFVGSGTTLLAAKDLNRNAVGFDLNKKYIELCEQRISQQNLFGNTKQLAFCDDAINIPEYFKENMISLVITSPPYACMLNRPRLNKSLRGDLREKKHYKVVQQYSTDPRDIGTMEVQNYIESLKKIFSGIFPLLRPKAHCVINITDLWWDNKRIILHKYIIDAMEEVGYELRNIIIWDRRNLVNNIGIFGWPNNYITLGTTFEYILDFWRP